ncbi:protein phosphatase-like protein 2c, partial [Saccharata proteae CBS 121410]
MWTPALRVRAPLRRPCSLACVYPYTYNYTHSHISHRRRRHFHDYFVTHLPSSSVHPDSRPAPGPHHKLPREESTPHTPHGPSSRSPAAAPPPTTSGPQQRDLTTVRIPLRSAKHHFGATVSRGTRPYNEDAYQAGTIEIPAFAKRRPVSLTRRPGPGKGPDGARREGTSAESASGDPQVFYFGVFDGHGGSECSNWLKEELHGYIEDGAERFELRSSLRRAKELGDAAVESGDGGQESLEKVDVRTPAGAEPAKVPDTAHGEKPPSAAKDLTSLSDEDSELPLVQSKNVRNAEELERSIVNAWKDLVGGYFKRFKPEHFSTSAGGQGHMFEKEVIERRQLQHAKIAEDVEEGVGIETVLTYAFLKADFDFVSAQVGKKDEDSVAADRALNDDDILDRPSKMGKRIGGPTRFKGGSTCSVALISTPTPSPYWHPASPSTLITAHVGDTRILLCNTATGVAVPLTSNHHPSLPSEATRLRRYAATFVTDSFGEERMSGLANTRAFGDMASKRVGVSAEPEIRRTELAPAEYSFMVMMSDGVSGPLGDQEIVDVVKEARTPDQGARDVVGFATEVAGNADNATALVVRLGGWERRSEGGLGSLGTKELRDWRRREAEDPRA